MACDETRVFVLGGELSPGTQADVTKLIYVLDTSMYLLFSFHLDKLKFENTEHLDFPNPDSGVVNPGEKTAQLVPKSSARPPTRGQLHQPSSSSNAHAAHGGSPFQKVTPEELDNPSSQQITRGQNPSLSGRPSRPTGASGRPRRIPEGDNDGEGSTEHRAKLVAPDAPSRRETAGLNEGRLIELERQLSEALGVKTEWDRRIAQLIDELALKSALLEQAEANAAAEAKKNAELLEKIRELQAKLDELLLSREHALEKAEANAAAAEAKKDAEPELRQLQAKLDELLLSREHALEKAEVEAKKNAELELRQLQAKLDESLLSRNHVIEQAEANAAEVKERARLELRELQAKHDESLLSRDHALQLAEANAAEEKRRAKLELRELQAKLDESLLSRDQALEQTQSALQKASCAAEATEQSQRELTEMRAQLGASKSELARFRLRLEDVENGCGESKTETDTYRTPTAKAPVNTNEDRVVHRLMERMQAMETEIASLRWNEKSFEMMECRNEE